MLQRQQHLQEKLAEEMLGLARSLKTNTLAAQNVIKMDNQVWALPGILLPLFEGPPGLGFSWMPRNVVKSPSP